MGLFGDVALTIVAVSAFFWLLRQNEQSPFTAFKAIRISDDRVAVWTLDTVYVIHDPVKEDGPTYGGSF